MKKSITLILSMLIIAPAVISGCGENTQPTVDSSQAETTEVNETINYTLNESFTYGDLTFKVDSNWTDRETIEDGFVKNINDSIRLCGYKLGYDYEIKSEISVLNAYSSNSAGSKITDKSFEVVDGRNVLLYTEEPNEEISLDGGNCYRHILTIVDDYSYDVYVSAPVTYKDECIKIISDIYKTLKITPRKIAESTTEAETIEETEASATEQLLIDENDVKIYYKGIGGEWSGPTVELRIENNSNKDYTVQARDVSVNGYMISPIFSCTVSGKKSANDGLSFLQSRLDENGIEAFHNVELSFHVFNKDDWDDYFDTEKVTIEI